MWTMPLKESNPCKDELKYSRYIKDLIKVLKAKQMSRYKREVKRRKKMSTEWTGRDNHSGKVSAEAYLFGKLMVWSLTTWNWTGLSFIQYLRNISMVRTRVARDGLFSWNRSPPSNTKSTCKQRRVDFRSILQERPIFLSGSDYF